MSPLLILNVGNSAEKVVILSQGKQLEQPSLEIANDQDRFHPAQIFSLDVNNLIIAATVSPSILMTPVVNYILL